SRNSSCTPKASEKISIQMITLIALSRLIPMKANYERKKKGKTMNPLAQFKKLRILSPPIALALVSPPVARADAVTDWNRIASNAIVVTAAQPPPVSVLHFAMVQGAVYDAANPIPRAPH